MVFAAPVGHHFMLLSKIIHLKMSSENAFEQEEK